MGEGHRIFLMCGIKLVQFPFTAEEKKIVRRELNYEYFFNLGNFFQLPG